MNNFGLRTEVMVVKFYSTSRNVCKKLQNSMETERFDIEQGYKIQKFEVESTLRAVIYNFNGFTRPLRIP